MGEENQNDWLYYLGLVTQLGLVVVATILVGFVLGVFIDRTLKSSPLFTMIFLAIGIAAGLFNAYQLIMRKMK